MVTDPEVWQSARGIYRMTPESSKYELMAFGRSHGPATRRAATSSRQTWTLRTAWSP